MNLSTLNVVSMDRENTNKISSILMYAFWCWITKIMGRATSSNLMDSDLCLWM
ncbi:hypothetical protein RintRC_6055 [Richelia intracellularis]|nr:hypothetical protein RintRC_6055 [Richelia intracellularis]